MAKKTIFISNKTGFYEEEVDYVFYPGFAFSQKQKNVTSLEDAIKKRSPDAKVLEVSTKSKEEIGVKLSAFKLTLGGIPVESIFQSSKVFLDGTQFDFVINYSAKDAKKYLKENSRGQLKCFRYCGKEYPLYPKSAFYDYIYIKALLEHKELSSELINYDVFTDVEFNSKKSINCQARACSIFAYLLKSDKVKEFTNDFSEFVKLYEMTNDILGCQKCYSQEEAIEILTPKKEYENKHEIITETWVDNDGNLFGKIRIIPKNPDKKKK